MTKIASLIGDPKEIDRELSDFRKTTRMLSAERPRMIERYPRQWVALYKSEVRASGSSLRAVLREVDRLGLPREHVIVRYIDKNQRTMIL